ncbi:hypothetical protein V5O48_017096 [Marasmius crinis-equi]|uniref:DUF1479-domain-containing protein n=1 Tax=Marasmius crinis-equi TaxID=585013 RepID=A0ABR3EPX9_9AGAR
MTSSAIPNLPVTGQKARISSDQAEKGLRNEDLTKDFPARFTDLKKVLWKDELSKSWVEVLQELETTAERISQHGTNLIPRVTHAELCSGLTAENLAKLKETGVIIVTGSVTKEEALRWKQDIKDYAAANSDHLVGYPPNNIQIFELYNAPAQIEARIHPGMISTHKSLLSLLHVSDPKPAVHDVDLRCPISYFDRLRIRLPGDKTYTLGPHVDGGSVERWEDPEYRSVYQKILDGNWKEYDPLDVKNRAGAKQDLYHGPNNCSIFRPWQGWTSLSTTGPTEGTLRVLPALSVVTAYMLLRPFFRLKKDATPGSLKAEDWEVDLDNPEFHGCILGGKQKFSNESHPHLRLDQTLISIPTVEPGDQVYWFCDILHAVEFEHRGKEDSSVIYIPAAPLTVLNAAYLRKQRETFVAGLPAPDFPGGEGESRFTGRVKPEDIASKEGRQAIGLESFVFDEDANDSKKQEFFREVNRVLGF